MKHFLTSFIIVSSLVGAVPIAALAADVRVENEANLPASQDPNSEEFLSTGGDSYASPAVEKSAASVKEIAPEAWDIPLIQTNNEVVTHADVTFVTGGVGEDERAAIEASKGDYNLQVTSANVGGSFEGDARIVISRKSRATADVMLSVVAGPLLYVRLPAGTYTLDAVLGTQKKHQTVTIRTKGPAARVALSWK